MRASLPDGAETERALGPQKTIGLVAHDNKKDDLIEWVTFNRHLIGAHQLVSRSRRQGTPSDRRRLEHPVACNRASADFMISSPLMTSDYERQTPDYGAYIDRFATPGPDEPPDAPG